MLSLLATTPATPVWRCADMPRASERRHDEHRDTPSRQLGNDLLVGQNVAYRHHAERNQYATIDRRTNVRSPGRVFSRGLNGSSWEHC